MTPLSSRRQNRQQFLHHINTQDPNIQFTVEELDQHQSLLFLDTKVTPGPNNTLITTAYRKPTHTDQYLHWNSNHFLTAKHNVCNTLAHRTKVVSSDQQSLHQELEHIMMALHNCHFLTWALNKLQQNFQHRQQNNNEPNTTDQQNASTNNNNVTNLNNNNNNNRNIYMVVPYIQGLGEKLKRTCNKKGIQVHFKDSNTIRDLLMSPKDKDTKLQKGGFIYQYQCPTNNCPVEYIGETGRAFGTGSRSTSEPPAPCPIHHHTSSTGHPVSPDCFNIVHRETWGTTRHIKQAMYMRAKDPSLNRYLGKYQLPHIWDQILPGTPGLKLR